MSNLLKFLIEIAKKSSWGLQGLYRGKLKRIRREYKFAARWKEFDWHWIIKQFSDDEFAEFLRLYSGKLDLNSVNNYKQTPLEIAIRANASLEKIKLFIKYGASPSMRVGYRKMTYLHIAAAIHSDPMVIEELAKYLAIDVPDKRHEPPIFYASVSQSNWDVIRTLLDYGADPTFGSREGDCTTFSLMLNDRQIFDKFLDYITADLSIEEVRQKLSHILVKIFEYALHGGEYPIEKRISDSEYLLALGADPNFFEGENALMYWVTYPNWFRSDNHIDGKKELIECLLQHGLDPNGPAQSGHFLNEAIEHDEHQIVGSDGALRLLFKYNANANIAAKNLFEEPKVGNLIKKAFSTKKPVYLSKLLLANGNKFYENSDLVIELIYELLRRYDRRNQHKLKILSGILRKYGENSLDNQGFSFLKSLSEKLGNSGSCLPVFLFEALLKMDQKLDLSNDAETFLEVCRLGDEDIFNVVDVNNSLVDSNFMNLLALNCRSPEVFEKLFHLLLANQERVTNCNFLNAGAVNYNEAAAVRICELTLQNSDKFPVGFGTTTKDSLLFRANSPQVIALLIENNTEVNQLDASGRTPLVQQLLFCETYSRFDANFLQRMHERSSDRRANVINLLKHGANPLSVAVGKVRSESNALVEIIELINLSKYPEYWMDIFNHMLQRIASDETLIASFADQLENLPKLKEQQFVTLLENWCETNIR